MSVADNVHDLLAPLFQGRGLEVYDLTYGGGVLRIIVDKPGGVSLDEVADASKVASRLLDDNDLVPGRYTLEMTSPGLERPLRRPEHYARAIGEEISVKLGPQVEGQRRIQGVLMGCDDDGITIEEDGVPRRFSFSDITKARTVFEWGPEPKKKIKEKSSR
ncbi:MAG: ribosome maturation factor RimP [Acidimicrobiia bacterium]|nr:ribosome maturation factor RimP [Acidimicrobiia bacterium]MYB11351.1 ribosome maturation factor RimP [Acidimicrobiia bacterium]MYG59131.1 ribosome maturation factor RimP [Acidimicrobiia bacterium]MYG73748.1 ribosome maturation factor RimP [Acidimicrobiia bacterium]MYJ33265.1 ribosome maturation factor RimP [Acidimicrobiia bacterium]